ncbi:AAA-ATPase At3g50940-like [Quercus robur]|uniref:AAA-ATPase At3g50940-like n=1 Tax=Quercus robur TaxID=38942 RepID=UPI002163CFC7|nr:AAA-ATPase At3g50940-like [Quercus robur]
MFTFREMLTTLAPFFTTAVVILLSPFVKEHIPVEVSNYLVSTFKKWLARISTPQVTIVIEERVDHRSNRIYEAATAKLRTLICDSTKPERFKVSKTVRQKESIFDIVKDLQIIDYFGKIRLKWMLCVERDEISGSNSKKLHLSFDRGSEKEVLDSYLRNIVDHYERNQYEETGSKLYTRNRVHGNYGPFHGSAYYDEGDKEWRYVSLEHPATFEKLAMNPEQKKILKDDLDIFLGRKDYYKKVGKAWKRGYLLYGPPGTGKTSLIAAMANYLHFNIYDLNLSVRYSDDDLRGILLSTTNRSILVIEDIDRGIKFNDERRKKIDTFTLSGLLNMIDGLWSSCGDERIIVFTTNDKDRLDPALLRPGRMDLHVHMSYCTMDGFKLLASNYLNIEGDHQLYGEIEGLLNNVEVTPAEIAEELLKSGGTDVVLGGLVKFLEQKILKKAKAAELKELLKSDHDTDVDVEGFVKFLKEEKLQNAKAEEAEQLLKSDHTDVDVDVDVEGLVKLFKQKKLADAKAADAKAADAKSAGAKYINPYELMETWSDG